MNSTKQGYFDLFNSNQPMELVVDNAKSHCVPSLIANTSQTTASSNISSRITPPKLVTLVDAQPEINFHHSFPPIHRKALTEQEEGMFWGNWLSSSESDLDHICPSFDNMLIEESSATTSATRNVSRPIRRGSLTRSSSQILVHPKEESHEPLEPLQRTILSELHLRCSRELWLHPVWDKRSSSQMFFGSGSSMWYRIVYGRSVTASLTSAVRNTVRMFWIKVFTVIVLLLQF